MGAANFPRSIHLSGQMRRPAISIPSNIAEGYERVTTGAFRQLLGYARGWCAEVETQLLRFREWWAEGPNRDGLMPSQLLNLL